MMSKIGFLFCLLLVSLAFAASFPVRRQRPQSPTTQRIVAVAPEATSEKCDYLPGLKLQDQDSITLCTREGLLNIDGTWIKRGLDRCDVQTWADSLDPAGESSAYNASTVDKTGTKFICHGDPTNLPNTVGLKYRFSPKLCSLERFNPGHAAELVNNECLGPVLLVGDGTMEILAAAWNSLVPIEKGGVEYRSLKSIAAPKEWTKGVEKFKTIVISPDWEPNLWNSPGAMGYQDRVHQIVRDIGASFTGHVLVFVGPNENACFQSKGKKSSPLNIMPHHAVQVWHDAIKSISPAKYLVFSVNKLSFSWPGSFPSYDSFHRKKCSWCLPGLPDMWAHVLYNVLHMKFLRCQVRALRRASMNVSLHEALFGAMDMDSPAHVNNSGSRFDIKFDSSWSQFASSRWKWRAERDFKSITDRAATTTVSTGVSYLYKLDSGCYLRNLNMFLKLIYHSLIFSAMFVFTFITITKEILIIKEQNIKI